VHLEDNYISFWIAAARPIARLHIVNSFHIEPQDMHYEEWNEIMVLIASSRSWSSLDRGVYLDMEFRCAGPSIRKVNIA
jgi:hypothetical protein